MIEILIGLLQTNNPFLVIIAGLMVGLLHAFEPDHLSAISTQLSNNANISSSKKPRLKSLTVSSSLKGMFWGMGVYFHHNFNWIIDYRSILKHT